MGREQRSSFTPTLNCFPRRGIPPGAKHTCARPIVDQQTKEMGQVRKDKRSGGDHDFFQLQKMFPLKAAAPTMIRRAGGDQVFLVAVSSGLHSDWGSE